jgi:hypothetical protein
VQDITETTPLRVPNGAATGAFLAAMPFPIYPGGKVAQWMEHECWEWLEEHIGECREDWYDSASEYMDRVDFSTGAADDLNHVDFCVWFRNEEDAAMFRLMFDVRH